MYIYIKQSFCPSALLSICKTFRMYTVITSRHHNQERCESIGERQGKWTRMMVTYREGLSEQLQLNWWTEVLVNQEIGTSPPANQWILQNNLFSMSMVDRQDLMTFNLINKVSYDLSEKRNLAVTILRTEKCASLASFSLDVLGNRSDNIC